MRSPGTKEQLEARRREVDRPRLKKTRREGRSLVFIDETGCMLPPVVRRTWAPQGCTPLLYRWDRHARLSIIGAITVAPRRKRASGCISISNTATSMAKTRNASLLIFIGPSVVLFSLSGTEGTSTGRLHASTRRSLESEYTLNGSQHTHLN